MRGSCRGATARYGLAALGLAVLLPLALAASPRRLDPVTVLAGSPNYPPGAAEQGVQGTTLLQATLAPDGRFSAPRVHQSSGSARLDETALALLPRLRSTAGAGEAGAAAATVLVPIAFRKDTLASLQTKSCADFNLDAAYFARTFPRRAVRDMPVFDLATAALAAAVPAARQVALARELPGIQQAVVSGCAADPEARFLELLLGAATSP